MFAKSTIVVALFASYVAAQGTTANSTIDPNTVSDTMKCESFFVLPILGREKLTEHSPMVLRRNQYLRYPLRWHLGFQHLRPSKSAFPWHLPTSTVRALVLTSSIIGQPQLHLHLHQRLGPRYSILRRKLRRQGLPAGLPKLYYSRSERSSCSGYLHEQPREELRNSRHC